MRDVFLVFDNYVTLEKPQPSISFPAAPSSKMTAPTETAVSAICDVFAKAGITSDVIGGCDEELDKSKYEKVMINGGTWSLSVRLSPRYSVV